MEGREKMLRKYYCHWERRGKGEGGKRGESRKREKAEDEVLLPMVEDGGGREAKRRKWRKVNEEKGGK